MNIKRLFASFCCFAALTCFAQVRSGEYIHVPEKRPALGIFPEQGWFTVGDVAHDAKFCLEDSKYHCFESQKVKFAVPKNLENETTWKYEGETYRVMQRFSTRGGYPAWAIEKSTGLRMWFVWSSHHGLMMIGEGASKNQQSGYMLDGVCGFAANATCQ
jgi:hypothetical protein